MRIDLTECTVCRALVATDKLEEHKQYHRQPTMIPLPYCPPIPKEHTRHA